MRTEISPLAPPVRGGAAAVVATMLHVFVICVPMWHKITHAGQRENQTAAKVDFLTIFSLFCTDNCFNFLLISIGGL